MLINHPTVGATRGLTLRVRLSGQNLKKDKKKKNYVIFFFFFFFAKKFVKRTGR